MNDRALAVNKALSQRLFDQIQITGGYGAAGVSSHSFRVVPELRNGLDADTPVEVIVTANEINDKHGTGPLVKRLFRGRDNLFSIRSKSDWGEQDFCKWDAEVKQESESRPDWFRKILRVLGGRRIESVFCVPSLACELENSIAIQASFGARLSIYLMDDQNIIDHVVPDELMREFLDRCSLRLVTHPELRHVYERKFGHEFHILPAIVPHQLVISEPKMPDDENLRSRRGALLGSFWDQGWFDATCEALAGCDSAIDWFGNNRSPWLTFSDEALQKAGIQPFGVVPEPELAARLRTYPFVIVPYARLDGRDSNPGVASLSLPGRILFALAASHTPVLVLGSDQSCAARLVRHLGIGEVAPYTAKGVSAAIKRLSGPKNQMRMRRNAASMAARLSDRGVVDWLRTSAEKGKPADRRFEEIFNGYDPSPVLDVLAEQGFESRL